MDEILSSIRQIIADEDKPAGQGAAEPAAVDATPESAQSEAEADKAMMAAQATESAVETVPEPLEDEKDEPLALTPDQMVGQSPDAVETETEKGDGENDNLDIAFSPVSSGMEANIPPSQEEKKQSSEATASVVEEPDAQFDAPGEDQGVGEKEMELVIADDVTFDESAGESDVPAVAEPMPDPKLSAQMADKLLEPATDAAVRHTFSKLNSLAVGNAELTLEGIVRDMLRPMLKEWLDENLPATVERMVEKEIERVSRGS